MRRRSVFERPADEWPADILITPRTHDMFDWVAGRSYPEGANLAAVNRARRRVE